MIALEQKEAKRLLSERFGTEPKHIDNGPAWIMRTLGSENLPEWIGATMADLPRCNPALYDMEEGDYADGVHVVSVETGRTAWAECVCWIVEELTDVWHSPVMGSFGFVDDQDAALFKLRFHP